MSYANLVPPSKEKWVMRGFNSGEDLKIVQGFCFTGLGHVTKCLDLMMLLLLAFEMRNTDLVTEFGSLIG